MQELSSDESPDLSFLDVGRVVGPEIEQDSGLDLEQFLFLVDAHGDGGDVHAKHR